MTTDRELLQRYVREDSGEAFEEIVRRHVDLVYGTALRQLCGNVSLAQDVTQAVFTALASKGDELLTISHLAGWLYGTTRFTASHAVRTERRRQDREQKAQAMHALLSESESRDSAPVPPELIDQMLEELEESDREAILRRFFEKESFRAIGLAMGMSEDAARMRVTRALEKIRALFGRHGITSSTAALGAALTNQITAAPANLAAGITAAALTGTAALIAPAGVKLGIITFMTTAKTTTWLAGGALVLALGYSGFQHFQTANLGEEVGRLMQEQHRLETALRQNEQNAAKSERRAGQAEQQLAELLRKPAETSAMKTSPAASRPAASRTDIQTLRAEKMARMKPLLEAGAPIKGAIISMVDGKPTPRPVEFVMGKETRIEAGDDGTYLVTPALNEDGSVNYSFSISKSSPDGVETKSEFIVKQTPWGAFTWGTKSGQAIAFDPDETGP